MEKLDIVAVWDGLTPVQQRQVGLLSIARLIAWEAIGEPERHAGKCFQLFTWADEAETALVMDLVRAGASSRLPLPTLAELQAAIGEASHES